MTLEERAVCERRPEAYCHTIHAHHLSPWRFAVHDRATGDLLGLALMPSLAWADALLTLEGGDSNANRHD